jgi:hypothetical protein
MVPPLQPTRTRFANAEMKADEARNRIRFIKHAGIWLQCPGSSTANSTAAAASEVLVKIIGE